MIQLHFRVPNAVEYTNWKGHRRKRVITPLKLYFGTTEYHPDPQWLVECIDNEDSAIKHFALSDIHFV